MDKGKIIYDYILESAIQKNDDGESENEIEDIEDQWGVHPFDLIVHQPTPPPDPDGPPYLSEEGSSEDEEPPDLEAMYDEYDEAERYDQYAVEQEAYDDTEVWKSTVSETETGAATSATRAKGSMECTTNVAVTSSENRGRMKQKIMRGKAQEEARQAKHVGSKAGQKSGEFIL